MHRCILLLAVAALAGAFSLGAVLPTAPAAAQTSDDRDGDGYPDDHDPCPDQAGGVATHTSAAGCPPAADTDGDGYVDSMDACPAQAGGPVGPTNMQGCPANYGEPCQIDTTIVIKRAVPSLSTGNVAEVTVEVNNPGSIIAGYPGGGGEEDGDIPVKTGINKIGVFLGDDRPIHDETIKVSLRFHAGGEAGYRCTMPDGSAGDYTTMPLGPAYSADVTFRSVVKQLAFDMNPKGAAAGIGDVLDAGGYDTNVRAGLTGSYRIVWTVTKNGKQVVVASGARKITKRGYFDIEVRLNAAGRSLLEGSKSVKLTARGTIKQPGAKPTKAARAIELEG